MKCLPEDDLPIPEHQRVKCLQFSGQRTLNETGISIRRVVGGLVLHPHNTVAKT